VVAATVTQVLLDTLDQVVVGVAVTLHRQESADQVVELVDL
jgi:hypothetical protein